MVEPLHNYQPQTYREAVACQEEWRRRVVLTPLSRPPRLVAGADAAYDKKDRRIFGAAALFTYPDLEWVEKAVVSGPCPFPYIPGLLSFREAPILAEALEKLERSPDVVLVDGQGLAHPRGLGLASHLGLLLNLPTIGVAKSRLVGEGEEPEQAGGSASPLLWEGRLVGLILRTQRGRRPLYLSHGHLITLEECREIVLECTKKYRLPEPLRQADILSRKLKKTAGG